MSIPVLLVTDTMRWIGAARLPRALVKAGFEVTLLAPRGSLAEHSGYIARIGNIPDNANPMQWVFALAASVKATSPRLVVPGDDTALRLLQMVLLDPPVGMQPALHAQLASLIRDSLGDPAHYRTVIDKLLLPPAARALGVPTPAFAIVGELREAEAFAASHGYPIVVKRDDSSAGSGVVICGDREGTAARLRRSQAGDRPGFRGRRARSSARAGAHQGRRVSIRRSPSREQCSLPMRANGWSPTRSPWGRRRSIATIAAPNCAPFRRSSPRGSASLASSRPSSWRMPAPGARTSLEVNRVAGGAHQGSAFNADHWAAMHAALEGRPSPTRSDLDEGEEHVTVHFP